MVLLVCALDEEGQGLGAADDVACGDVGSGSRLYCAETPTHDASKSKTGTNLADKAHTPSQYAQYTHHSEHTHHRTRTAPAPEITETAPNSPIARALVRMMPYSSPHLMLGSVTCQNTWVGCMDGWMDGWQGVMELTDG